MRHPIDQCPIAHGAYRDNLWRQPHWYAVQSKPGREAFAAANVARLGVQTLLPRLRQRTRGRGARALRIAPLFTGYLFARFTPEARLNQVRSALGVLRVVSSGRTALPVDDAIIEAIEARADEEGVVDIALPRLQPGDQVRVEEGPFQGLLGVLERESDDRTRVTILLESLHFVRVWIDRRCLAEAEAA